MHYTEYASTKNREDQVSLRSRGNDVKDHHSDYDRLERTLSELTTGFVHRG